MAYTFYSQEGADGIFALIESLNTGLSGKADLVHTHTENQITGLAESIAGRWGAWTGTQAQYDALPDYDPGTLYVVVG